MKSEPKLGAVLIAALMCWAPIPESKSATLASLKLDDLLQKEVTSVSRRSERLSDAAAAVFVISSEDIQRSGAKSIPEALRMAPGVDAVRLSANRWSVSIRGFNDRFSNKLLVLVDGRNAYHPAFSGVFWETLLLPLTDIERIEVIRGPGAVIWGTNAVNGVINIISKSSVATSGLQLTAGSGDRHGSSAQIRYGGQIANSRVHYRAYGTFETARPFESIDGKDARDEYENHSGGLRMDGYFANGGRWNVSGEIFEVESDEETFIPVPCAPFVALIPATQKNEGANIRGRLQGDSFLGDYEVQAAYAYADTLLPVFGRYRLHNYDLDAQLRPSAFGAHQITLGGGFRLTADEVSNGMQQSFQVDEQSATTVSIYAQDEVKLSPTVATIVGLRVEDHEYSGVEVLPSLRLRWNISPRRMAWANVSRAARSPSRAERTFSYTLSYQQPPGAPQPIQSTIIGSENFDTEYLVASEIGFRQQLSTRASLDLTLFHHDYSDLRSFDMSGQNPQLPLQNNGALEIYGAELSAAWRPRSNLNLSAAYAWNQSRRSVLEDIEDSRIVSHIANLRVGYMIRRDLTADLSAYYKSERDAALAFGSRQIDPFTSTTASLRWQVTSYLRLSLAGYDLLDSSHIEGQTQTPVRPDIEVPRGAYAEIQLQF